MDNLSNLEKCSLIALSLFFLPLSTCILVFSYACSVLLSLDKAHRFRQLPPSLQLKTVLVTGAATPQGLRIARALHQAGHKVIGADFEPDRIPSHARLSKAFTKFHSIRFPNDHYGPWLYIQDLVHMVQEDKVDLWISCSAGLSAGEIAQARDALELKTTCICIAPDGEIASKLKSRSKFLSFVKELGLAAPEMHRVNSRADVHNVLNDSHGSKKYLLTSANGIADEPHTQASLILPRRTLSQTYQHVSAIRINRDNPWILEQHFEEMEQYTCFALVIGGKVTAFAASPLLGNKPYLTSFSTTTGLGKAMLRFTQSFAAKAGKSFTAHLSINFKASEKSTDSGYEKVVIPTNCQTQVSPMVLLFQGKRGYTDLANAYMGALKPNTNGTSNSAVLDDLDVSEPVAVPFPPTPGVYFIGPEMLTLIMIPALRFLTFKLSILQLFKNSVTFMNHLIHGRDGIFEIWDPLPFWWLYQIYLPVRLAVGILSKRKSNEMSIMTPVG